MFRQFGKCFGFILVLLPIVQCLDKGRWVAKERCVGDGSLEPECEKVGKYLSHQYNCSKFWECGPNLVPCLFECPPISGDIGGGSLYFNPDLGICDWPFNVGCTMGEALTTDPVLTEASTADFTTDNFTTAVPTTAAPTTANLTTASIITDDPTTAAPTTTAPTTVAITTAAPTTAAPTTAAPTTAAPTTAAPTTASSTTASSTTASSTTASQTTVAQTTAKPTTAPPTTAVRTTEENTMTTTISSETSTASIESFLCEDYYCSYIGHEQLDKLTTIHTFDLCEAACTAHQECSYFTFTNLRNRPLCYLLSGCVLKTPCVDTSNCQSGHKDCA